MKNIFTKYGIAIGVILLLGVALCINYVCGINVYAQNEEKPSKGVDNNIEYTYTKNDRIQVLSTSVITASRKSTMTYWLMCIDGYRYLVVSQSSGVAASQMFFDKDTPLMCTKQDKD